MAQKGRRRAYGQHFLKDKGICLRIAQETELHTKAFGCSAILEIGPGRGAITYPLLESAKNTGVTFLICEKDPILVQQWRDEQNLPPYAKLFGGDFLTLPESDWLTHTPLAVASNLPYSSGTAIFTRLAEHPDKIAFMILMFQAEVAARLRATVGSKEWGSLSVWTQNRWDVKKFEHVPPGAFIPPPEVQSEIVTLIPRKEPYVKLDTPQDKDLFDKLLRTAFTHRRKMMRSGLPSGFWRNVLEHSKVDGTKRAEALQFDEWQRLFDAAKQLKATETI